MSKKKKRKFYNSPTAPQPVSQSSVSASMPMSTSSSFSAPSSTPANPAMGDAHVEEYRVIKHDLIKVVILNAIFLAGVLTLYYTNLNSHYLERWFSSILHF